MHLPPYLEPVVPALTKALLKAYIGADAAGAVGSAFIVALKHFGDRSKATTADAAARELARSVLGEIEPWFNRELPAGDTAEFYANELSDTIERGFCERSAVEVALDPIALASRLAAPKQDEWKLSGPNAQALLNDLVRAVCFPLARLVPSLPNYAFERDQVLLDGLQRVLADADTILEGQKTANEALETIRVAPERVWQRYEEQYRRAIAGSLDYVEILGLDLKREDRTAALSVAYLSLTVDEGNEAEPTALRFEDLLTLLPLRGGRLVIEGAAGSGKSTLLRWAAIHLADPTRLKIDRTQALRGTNIRRFLQTMLPPVVPGDESEHQIRELQLASIVKSLTETNEDVGVSDRFASVLGYLGKLDHEVFLGLSGGTPVVARVPFLVRLRDMERGRFPGVDELANVVVDIGRPPPGWILSVLNEGRGVILVDGVDEVSEERGTRASAMAALRRMAATFPGNLYIVAGRPGAFNSAPFDGDSVRVTVDDMNDDQRRVFVERWHSAKAARQETKADVDRTFENAAKLRVELEQNGALRRMASNPLIAASICALHDQNPTTVPRNEYELCERLAKMLVSARDLAQDESGHSVDLAQLGRAYGLQYSDKRTVISRLADQMIQNGESVLSWSEARSVVADILPRLSRSDGVPADALLAALAIRSGVLRPAIAKVEEGDGEEGTREAVEFVHNRFKEWFAAISYRDRNQPTELASRLPDDPYDQIAIFAVAADGAATFSDELMRILNGRVSAEQMPSRKRAMKLTGVRLSDAATVLAPEWRTWAASMSGQLFPPSNKSEARALSHLGDTAVPFLRRRATWTARQAALAAYCLQAIGTPAAIAALESYMIDDRWTVAQEAVSPSNIFRSEAVRKRILAGKTLSGNVGVKLTTFSGFGDIDRVTKLDLSYTAFTDVASLRGASKLTELHLSGSRFRSIEPISELSSLRRLFLNAVSADDYKPIGKLKLSILALASSTIEDIGDLGVQSEVASLYLGATAISDIAPLEKWKSIQILSLMATKLKSLSVIATLPKLRSLYIDGIQGADVAEFSRATSIHTISMSRIGDLKNFDLVAGFRQLKDIDASFSSVSKLDSLKELQALTRINVDNTDVHSVDSLAELPNLARLDMEATKVTDVGPLAALPKLRSIFASRCAVRDFSPLLASPSLRWLYVSPDVDIDERAFAAKSIAVGRRY